MAAPIRNAYPFKRQEQDKQRVVYQPQGSNAGLAGLIADAVAAAITKSAPNYIPLARQANGQAINLKDTGLSAGPFDGLLRKDPDDF
jgi:hypothetical protein